MTSQMILKEKSRMLVCKPPYPLNFLYLIIILSIKGRSHYKREVINYVRSNTSTRKMFSREVIKHIDI